VRLCGAGGLPVPDPGQPLSRRPARAFTKATWSCPTPFVINTEIEPFKAALFGDRRCEDITDANLDPNPRSTEC
jgi:hypothetical protein